MGSRKKIYITGHLGMVGSACWKNLRTKGDYDLIGKTSTELDLRSQKDVKSFFNNERPNIVIHAAARVGGIFANSSNPYEFLMDNLLIQNNVISSSFKYDVEKFIFLGSSCIYPKNSKQPIKEKYLLGGYLEETNQWYSLAKISGLKLIEALSIQYGKNFFSLMPTNLYGPNDNYDLENSHVLPAMLRKFHEAKLNNNSDVILWGTGEPKREFLHVDDLAEIVSYFVENDANQSFLNVGSSDEISIKNLARLIQEIVGHEGDILWDKNKPDGTKRKLLDCTELHKLGLKSKISLNEGIRNTYENYINENGD
jgi:GDP-L-fucose synthase